MIYLGADHRGFQLKEKIKEYLIEQGIPCEDLGAFVKDSDDDFTDYAQKVAAAVAANPEKHRGILFCGSGVGMDVVANKHQGLIAGLLFAKEQAIEATAHDQINVASLPADFLSLDQAQEILNAFLTTPYSQEERHIRRVNKIKEMEKE